MQGKLTDSGREKVSCWSLLKNGCRLYSSRRFICGPDKFYFLGVASIQFPYTCGYLTHSYVIVTREEKNVTSSWQFMVRASRGHITTYLGTLWVTIK